MTKRVVINDDYLDDCRDKMMKMFGNKQLSDSEFLLREILFSQYDIIEKLLDVVTSVEDLESEVRSLPCV